MTSKSDGRRLAPAALLQHWHNGVPVVIPIAGTPPLSLRIDKPRSHLTLRAPMSASAQLPVNPLAYVSVETLVEGGSLYLEVSTTDARLVVDGYAMLMAIADRIQIDGAEPTAALTETLEIWAAILSRRTRLSLEAEVGLFGELLFLRALVETGTAKAAAWRAGFGEEHDFGLPRIDVEVKTTSSERRHHWIPGLTQLVPTGKTPLWVVSVQITRSGEGLGETLPELIGDVLTIATDADRAVIEENLTRMGWDDGQRDLFSDRWRLRSAPAAFQVTDRFPRLTPDLLTNVAIDMSRLRQVNYEIQLDDLECSSPPPALAAVNGHLRKVAQDG